MHLLANRRMLEHLKAANIVRGDVEEMIDAGINAVFMVQYRLI